MNDDTANDDEINLNALSRAARFIAAWRAQDRQGARQALNEARGDDTLLEFGIAAGILAAQLADKLHGPERAQLHLDGLALDAAWFRDQELKRLNGSRDDRE